MPKHPITASLEFVGEWACSSTGEPTPMVAGTLTWSDRASLQLHGSFREAFGPPDPNAPVSYAAIHGVTTKSQLLTMLEANRASWNWSFGPAGIRQPEKFISSWVVVGAHVELETKYTEIRARIPGLEKWLSRSGIRQTLFQAQDGRPAAVTYEVEALPEERFEVPAIPGSLGWGIDRSFGGDRVSEISVRTAACLRICPAEPQSLEWLFATLDKATTLLAFIAGSPMSPDHVEAKVAESGGAVEILVALRESKYCSLGNATDFFMTRDSMRIGLGEVFARWFEINDSLGLTTQLALSVLSSDDLWLHVEFLSLMQALEGLHRALLPGLYTTEEAYAPIRDALCAAIPATVDKDHRASLRSRMRYGNEVSLRKRLDALIHRLGEPLRQAILGPAGSIPNSWVDTRNYYTHWDEASRENVLDSIGMHRASVRMRALLRVLFLDLVHIPGEAILQSLGNGCSESQYLIQLNAMHRKGQVSPEQE